MNGERHTFNLDDETFKMLSVASDKQKTSRSSILRTLIIKHLGGSDNASE